ncbi:MAG: radical SAM protein, partial [Bacillota bacterium]|nr:radical SAM protein [Bacillota bacterium]
MRIIVTGNRGWISTTVRDILSIFQAELATEAAEYCCAIEIDKKNHLVTANAVISFLANKGEEVITDSVAAAPEVDIINQEKRLCKKVMYQALARMTGLKSQWGILTGIRPTKLVHRLLDQHLSSEEIVDYLRKEYLISKKKCNLLMEIARSQREFLLSPQQAREKVGVYIGIPFCPSRCLYCSFPAYSLANNSSLKTEFVKALLKEISELAKVIKGQKLIVQHIYIGGGTPTSLDNKEMELLLDTVNCNLRNDATEEVTVEAGRPDTLNEAIIHILKEHQVTRVSVNPQTLQDKTLKIIGRNHTKEDFWRAYQLVKEIGIPVVNV